MLSPIHPGALLALLAAVSPLPTAMAKQMTIVNSRTSSTALFNMPWPALLGQSEAPGAPNGWEAGPGSTKTINVPDDWMAGRIWARTGCDFSDAARPGAVTCLTGGCEGGMECTAYGKPPCTLAEFGLGKHAGADFYDLSLVDGFNLPAAITPFGGGAAGCVAPSCSADLLAGCPAELQTDRDANGHPHGCASACIALGVLETDCCSGAHAMPETCPGSGVRYRAHFKERCGQAYSYAYDDPSSLFTCGGEGRPLVQGYKVEFCPTA